MTLAWPPALRTDFIVYPPPKKNAVTHHQTLLISLKTFVHVRAPARTHTVTICFTFFFFSSIHFMKCVDESSTLPFSGDENAHDSYQNKTQYN